MSKLLNQFSGGHYAHINQLPWSFKNHTQLNWKEKCFTKSIYLEAFCRLGENTNVMMLQLPKALEFGVLRLTCWGLFGAHEPTQSYNHSTYHLWPSDDPNWPIWFSSYMHYCLSSSRILYLLATRRMTTTIYFSTLYYILRLIAFQTFYHVILISIRWCPYCRILQPIVREPEPREIYRTCLWWPRWVIAELGKPSCHRMWFGLWGRQLFDWILSHHTLWNMC